MHIVCPHCFVTNNIPPGKSQLNATCGKCHKPVHTHQPAMLNQHNFYKYIEKNAPPVLVDFWASWCGPCQVMAPVFAKLAAQSESILFAKLETEQAQQISADAGIRSIPTLILFNAGTEVDRTSGALAEPQLKQWIMQAIQKC